MEVQGRFIEEIIPDNEQLYLGLLQAVLESVDELCNLEITKLKDGYIFRIAPSIPSYCNPLLQEVLKLNNIFHIHLDLSKSIKNNSTINFEISLK